MTPLRERLDQIANSVIGCDLIDGASLYRQSMARERHRHALWGGVAAAAVVAGVVIFASLVDVGTGGNPRIAPASPPPLVEPSDSSDPGAVCPVGEERAVFPGIPRGESTSVPRLTADGPARRRTRRRGPDPGRRR